MDGPGGQKVARTARALDWMRITGGESLGDGQRLMVIPTIPPT